MPVGDGYFSVYLGSVTPLSASDFDDPTRYLQVSVDDGGGFVDLPRQQFAAVPYALQAQEAASAPWSGLTDVPAGFADGVDDGADYANMVVVAKSGGDFSSVQAAIDSIGDATADVPYLVWVAPGTYSETVTIKPYVHLQGAGQEATLITSTVSNNSFPPAAGTLALASYTSLRDLTVSNSGAGVYNVALLATDGTTCTLVTDVTARAEGVGVDGENYAIFQSGSSTSITLQNVTALSENGDQRNVGLNNYGATTTLRGGSFIGRGGKHNALGIHNWGSATLEAEGIIVLAENSPHAYGLFNDYSTARLYSGSFTGSCGIYNESYGSNTLMAESVTAVGFWCGLYNEAGTVTLHGGSFTANRGSDNRGIVNNGTLAANNIIALAEGGGGTGWGLINNNSGNATLYGGSFIGRGGIEAYGIINGGGLVTITQAVLQGATYSASGPMSISNSRLIGGGVSGGGCTAVSRGTTFLASGCP